MKSIRFTTDQLNAHVLRVIQSAQPTIDNRISKDEIAMRVYGFSRYELDEKFNTSVDRKIRDAVTELVMQGHPICATSDQPGYYLARNIAEAEQCIAELTSRAGVYFEKIEGIKRGLRQDKPKQMVLEI